MNRLGKETSPYLLQHAHNPVDWYAWKPEAFERARAEDKPILVSIGYSTCHWCHVMERESFENEEIAAYMNDHYVCIKVDREERPDVDHIYMEACQILTGGGGWPLNCFLTPDGKPFYAGTYFPPRPAHNRPSWLQLLQHLSNIWHNKRALAEDQAEKLLANISRNDDVLVKKNIAGAELVLEPNVFGNNPFSPALLENIFYKMREGFDRVEGGFGGAPKFPSSMAIQYLLNYHYFTGNPESLQQATLSLDKMIMGGIYDQIGGGFARYATDRAWLVPHFEKMLYDNALLVSVLAEAYKLTKKELYRETIIETLEYIDREMTHPEGGFYSAQDADSEGVEGKFFVWDKDEVTAVLGEDAPLFNAYYDVSAEGNWEEKNILWRQSTFSEFAGSNGIALEQMKRTMQHCRAQLFEVRKKRIHPGLDDKILLGWNALMATAYAQAYTAIGKKEYKDAAVQNVAFLLEKFADSDGKMLHTWKDGAAQYDAFLEDYAFFVAALIEVYQITFDLQYLTFAEKYTDHVLSYFYDDMSGLFFFTGKAQKDIIVRRKDIYDNATPSGNSTMALNLQRLGILLDRTDWREISRNMLLSMRETVERFPLSFQRWAAGMMNEVHPYHEIAVIGDNAIGKANVLNRQFLPNKVIAASKTENTALPLLVGKTGAKEALIYVCRDFACQRPVETLKEFQDLTYPQ